MKWKRIRDTFGHAFAMPKVVPLTEEEEALLDKMAKFIVRRQMIAPAMFFLRSLRPLNYVGSQLMWVLQPVADLFIKTEDYVRVQNLLERRESIDLLLERMERLEDEQIAEKTERKEKV